MAWITAMMEITPCEDIEMIIKQYNYLLEGIKIYDSTDKLLPLFPLEIMGSALFEYMANHIPNFVHGADFRETYRAYSITCPEYAVTGNGDELGDEGNKSVSIDILPSTPPDQQIQKTPIVRAGAAPRKRGRPPKNKK
jgi:hypothetical protein